jgi:hypothetical protein
VEELKTKLEETEKLADDLAGALRELLRFQGHMPQSISTAEGFQQWISAKRKARIAAKIALSAYDEKR